MRILFVSNFYPPLEMGGLEQNCHEIVEGLQTRGHACYVLTSRHNASGQSSTEDGVSRVLHIESDIHYYRPLDFFLRRPEQERANQRALSEGFGSFHPDLIFIWGMWNLSRQIAHWAEELAPGRVAYYLADYWLMEPNVHEVYWQKSPKRTVVRLAMAPVRGLAIRQLARERDARPPLALEQVACVSEYVRAKLTAAGLLPHGARVLYNGIDPEPFMQAPAEPRPRSGTLRLVYTGGMIEQKGAHTAVEALGLLKQHGNAEGLHLTLVGGGHPGYVAGLRRRVRELSLEQHVTFRGRVPRDQIPAILAEHDAFVFTSIYEEPIARSVMEAMAAGLAVIGTTVGGQREMLEDGENALVFAPGDAAALAARIAAVKTSPDLARRVAQAGRRTVLERFTLDRMVEKIEEWLEFSFLSRAPAVQSGSGDRMAHHALAARS